MCSGPSLWQGIIRRNQQQRFWVLRLLMTERSLKHTEKDTEHCKYLFQLHCFFSLSHQNSSPCILSSKGQPSLLCRRSHGWCCG